MITRPTGMSLEDWAAQVTMDLGVVVRLTDDDWQAWGSQLLSALAGRGNPPNPAGFSDWRDWAERLCSTL